MESEVIITPSDPSGFGPVLVGSFVAVGAPCLNTQFCPVPPYTLRVDCQRRDLIAFRPLCRCPYLWVPRKAAAQPVLHKMFCDDL